MGVLRLCAFFLGLFVLSGAVQAQTLEQSRTFAEQFLTGVEDSESGAFLTAYGERYPGSRDDLLERIVALHQEHGDSGVLHIADGLSREVQRMFVNAMLSARDQDIISFQQISNQMIDYMAGANPRLCQQAAGGALGASDVMGNAFDPEFQRLSRESADAMATLVFNSHDEPVAVDMEMFFATSQTMSVALMEGLTPEQVSYLQGQAPLETAEDHRQYCLALVETNDIVFRQPLPEAANYFRAVMRMMAGAQ